MIIDHCKEPESSFLTIEKDLSLITDLILRNNNLKKLLYYTTNDAQTRPSLTPEQTYSLFGKNIQIVPKLEINKEVLNYILINFDDFIPNGTNTQFRNNLIYFDIVCHYNNWYLKDFQLRPYRIAGEIDAMINERHLTGIGLVRFMGAKQLSIDDEFAGITLMYETINGDEDKRKMLNPEDEQQMIENFNELWENS